MRLDPGVIIGAYALHLIGRDWPPGSGNRLFGSAYHYGQRERRGQPAVRPELRLSRRSGLPATLRRLVDELKGSPVRAQIPISFPAVVKPRASSAWRLKKASARRHRHGHGDEHRAFKAGDYARVARDICEVMTVARPYQIPSRSSSKSAFDRGRKGHRRQAGSR